MKSQFVALAVVLAALPALAWGQGTCGCNSHGPVRPASYGVWSDYHSGGHQDGCGCASCTSCVSSCTSSCNTCCSPCCGRQLLCIIPNTVKKIGCALDCLMPRGPICCHNRGCGMSCSSGCPSCTGGVSDPFIDDMPGPPMPPKPAAQETRRQPMVRAPRDYAAAPSTGNKMAASKPATKSVLTRNSQPAEQEVSRTTHSVTPVKKQVSVIKRASATTPVEDADSQPSSRRQSASRSQSSSRSESGIPHNPLR